MSEQRKAITDSFNSIAELSGQKGQYKKLDSATDELIDALNDFTAAATEEDEKAQARKAIEGLMNIKDDDIAKVKLTEDEARGKGATINKERAYSRQLDSAIQAIRSEIAYFLS